MDEDNDNVKKIFEIESNNKCADCGRAIDSSSGWASMSFGVCICIDCAGIHRTIGGNQIKSFEYDTRAWKDSKNVDFLLQIGGNSGANNRVWECHLPYFWINPKLEDLSPETICDDDKVANFRKFFIQNKYENQLFTPLRMKEYFTSKNQSIFEVPFDSKFSFNAGGNKQTSLQFYNLYNKNKWSKKPLFICIHSSYLSLYPNSKITKRKNDHIKTLNLIPLKITVNNMDDDKYNNDEEQWFEFQIVEDESHLFEFQYFKQDEHNEPLLRGRCKDFNVFVQYVHELRKVASYYRMYNELIKSEGINTNPPLDINYSEFNKNKKVIGLGQVFGASKTSHFYVMHEKLYVFKADPFNSETSVISASIAWNLLKIDLKQDKNGDRTGIKHSVLIIEPYKMIPIKFENGRMSETFYKRLFGIWTEIRGAYLVDFKDAKPVILDETNEDNLMNDQARAPRKSAMIHIDYSQVQSASLNTVRPPEILEILAKMEKLPATPVAAAVSGLPPPSFDIDEADVASIESKETQAAPKKMKFNKFKKRAEPLSPHNTSIVPRNHPHIDSPSLAANPLKPSSPRMIPLQLVQSTSNTSQPEAMMEEVDQKEDAFAAVEDVASVQIAVNGSVQRSMSPKAQNEKQKEDKSGFNDAFNQAFDTALATEEATPKLTKWKCNRCTYTNDSWDRKCAICGFYRAESQDKQFTPLPTNSPYSATQPLPVYNNMEPQKPQNELQNEANPQDEAQEPSQDQPLPRPQYSAVPFGTAPSPLPGLPRPPQSPSPPTAITAQPRMSLPRPPQPPNNYPLDRVQPKALDPQSESGTGLNPPTIAPPSSLSSLQPKESPIFNANESPASLPQHMPHLPLESSSSNPMPNMSLQPQSAADSQIPQHNESQQSQASAAVQPYMRQPQMGQKPMQPQARRPQPQMGQQHMGQKQQMGQQPMGYQAQMRQMGQQQMAQPQMGQQQQQQQQQQQIRQQAMRQQPIMTQAIGQQMRPQMGQQMGIRQQGQMAPSNVQQLRIASSPSMRQLPQNAYNVIPQQQQQQQQPTHNNVNSFDHSPSGSQRSFGIPQTGSQRSFGGIPQTQSQRSFGSNPQSANPNMPPSAPQHANQNSGSHSSLSGSQRSFHHQMAQSGSQRSFGAPSAQQPQPQLQTQPPQPQSTSPKAAHSPQSFGGYPSHSPQYNRNANYNYPNANYNPQNAYQNQNGYNQNTNYNQTQKQNMSYNQNYNQNMQNRYQAQQGQQQQQQHSPSSPPQQQQAQAYGMYNQQQQRQQQMQSQRMQQQQYNPHRNYYNGQNAMQQMQQYGSHRNLQPLQQQQYMFKKRKSGAMMHHIKLNRLFVMSEAQKTNITQNINWVKTMLGKYATIELKPEIGCYKLSIPAHVPLPNRKAYWQNILKNMRNNVGMSQERLI